MQIGNLHILNPLFLAPMAGVTDLPFRIICKDMGANLVYTEFVSSNGIIRENKNPMSLMEEQQQRVMSKGSPLERPFRYPL